MESMRSENEWARRISTGAIRRQRVLLASAFVATAVFIPGQVYSSVPEDLIQVDDFGDGHDATPGDGVCATSDGRCTLRALFEENPTAFAILPEGRYTLSLDEPIRVAAFATVFSSACFLGVPECGDDVHQTVIDGDGNGRIFVVEPSAYLIIEGLTITNGATTDTSGFNGDGGCIHVDRANVRLEMVAFDGCSAFGKGGAVALSGNETRANIDQVAWARSDASQGGALAAFAGARLDIRRNSFLGNKAAQHGGAIFAEAETTILRSFFGDNIARRGSGGAVHIATVGNAAGDALFQRVNFFRNRAHRHGGAVYLGQHGRAQFYEANFRGNEARCDASNSACDYNSSSPDNRGGGIAAENYQAAESMILSFSRTLFEDNKSDGDGGAAWVGEQMSARFSNVTFADNNARRGGGIKFRSRVPHRNYLTNVTFSSNRALSSDGGDHLNIESALLAPARVDARNVIFADESGHTNCVGTTKGDNNPLLRDKDPNIDADGSCVGDETEALLGPLTEFEGPDGFKTAAFPPLEDSPAIAGGSVRSDGNCLNTSDQRGVARDPSNGCWIGAYEE